MSTIILAGSGPRTPLGRPPLHIGPLPRGPLPCAGLLLPSPKQEGSVDVPTAPAENRRGEC